MLVTGDIAAVGGNPNTPVAFKNCAPFRRCVTHINNEHVETAENMDIIIPMYNLLEYSDNYADSSGSLWQFKRDEQNMTEAGNPDNVTASLLKAYFPEMLYPNIADAHGLFINAEIAFPLKYLSNFFRSL